MAGDDPHDDVSGTLGLTGAADVVLVLKRPRYQYDGTLFITGRDVDEQELVVRFDPQYCLWSITEAAPDRLPAEQRKVVEVLTAAGQPMPPMEVAARPGMASLLHAADRWDFSVYWFGDNQTLALLPSQRERLDGEEAAVAGTIRSR